MCDGLCLWEIERVPRATWPSRWGDPDHDYFEPMRGLTRSDPKARNVIDGVVISVRERRGVWWNEWTPLAYSQPVVLPLYYSVDGCQWWLAIIPGQIIAVCVRYSILKDLAPLAFLAPPHLMTYPYYTFNIFWFTEFTICTVFWLSGANKDKSGCISLWP